MQLSKTILTEEKNNLPHGFKIEEDVDLTAPRIFSDSYVLNFIHNTWLKLDFICYSQVYL